MSKTFLGLVFPNTHDNALPELTAVRSMGSVPFGGRYRLIDFALSNLVNAGVEKVGIITTNKYQSLMDHIGSGKPWDLDRKINGIHFIPPYTYGTAKNAGSIDLTAGAMPFLTRSKEDYVAICASDVVANIDLSPVFKQHIDSGADFTICYTKETELGSYRNIMQLEDIDADGRVKTIRISDEMTKDINCSLGIIIVKRELLIEVVKEASSLGKSSLSRQILQSDIEKYKVYGYEVKDFAKVITDFEGYVNITKSVSQNADIRKQVFNPKRPIFTKVRDDMPTKYGLDSDANASLIANGCVVDGEVKNSVLFRGVKVSKGAKVENCILMQDCVIGENANLKNITADKNVTVGDGVTLNGGDKYPMYIKKGATV